LIDREKKYGGFVRKVERKKFSIYDTRPLPKQKYEMGGDRMDKIHHGYGSVYAKYLLPLVNSKERVVITEVGILRGSGVAIWSDLFPNGRVIGLDIDLRNIADNMHDLLQKGAFMNENFEMEEFDQFKNNKGLLKRLLRGDKIDVVIDDASHTDQGILNTFKDMLPYLNKHFIYFIEDNHKVAQKLKRIYPEFNQQVYGRLVIIYL
jgi:hypothetical protein